MSSVWDRFDKIATPDEVETAKNSFVNPDAGEYSALLELLEAGESKDHLPTMKSRFRLVEGNKIVFYNIQLQNISKPEMTAINIANAVAFVSKIVGEDVAFTGLGAFAELIAGIQVGGMYRIKISYSTKDVDKKFPKVTIIGSVDENLPFDV